MQEPRPDLETRNAERAVKAGEAAVKSVRHISKQAKKDPEEQADLTSEPGRRLTGVTGLMCSIARRRREEHDEQSHLDNGRASDTGPRIH